MKRIRKDELEQYSVGDDLIGEESINSHQRCSELRNWLIVVILRLPRLSQRLMALGTALKQPEAAQLVVMTTQTVFRPRSPVSPQDRHSVQYPTKQTIRFRFVFFKERIHKGELEAF